MAQWHETKKTVCHNEDFDKRIVLHSNIKKYENHSSIIKIQHNMSVKSHLSSNNTLASAKQVSSNEINLTLKSLNTNKTTVTDKIPTKIGTLASNFLSTPLVTAINSSIASSNLGDIAKVTTAIPIDKRTDDKYDISNFRPVS